MTSSHPPSNEHHRVTARDINEFLHHLTQLRRNPHPDNPAPRAALLAHKADLLTRIATQTLREHPDDPYTQQTQHIATNARATAHRATHPIPHQRVGPTPSATPPPAPTPGGARTKKNSGASSG
jgi:hypothetical protein